MATSYPLAGYPPTSRNNSNTERGAPSGTKAADPSFAAVMAAKSGAGVPAQAENAAGKGRSSFFPATAPQQTERLYRSGQGLPPGSLVAGQSNAVQNTMARRQLQQPMSQQAELAGPDPTRPTNPEATDMRARFAGTRKGARVGTPQPNKYSFGMEDPRNLRGSGRSALGSGRGGHVQGREAPAMPGQGVRSQPGLAQQAVGKQALGGQPLGGKPGMDNVFSFSGRESAVSLAGQAAKEMGFVSSPDNGQGGITRQAAEAGRLPQMPGNGALAAAAALGNKGVPGMAGGIPGMPGGMPGSMPGGLGGAMPSGIMPPAGPSRITRESLVQGNVPDGTTYGAVPSAQAYARGGDKPWEMAVRSSSHKRAEGTLDAGRVPLQLKGMHPGAAPKGGLAGQRPGYPGAQAVPEFSESPGSLGALAARFESGADGIAAVGYDSHGGTSYGKFQISSRAGTMKQFMSYLSEKAPDLAKRLGAAGPANTGGKGGRMPETWKAIASEQPDRFEQLQNDFVHESHFEPAAQALEKNTGVSFSNMPEALREVLFSTAVQHGAAGAVRIVSRALERLSAPSAQQKAMPARQAYETGKELIQHIYAIRAGQFGSSSMHVQSSVKNRLQEEMQEALSMFGTHKPRG